MYKMSQINSSKSEVANDDNNTNLLSNTDSGRTKILSIFSCPPTRWWGQLKLKPTRVLCAVAILAFLVQIILNIVVLINICDIRHQISQISQPNETDCITSDRILSESLSDEKENSSQLFVLKDDLASEVGLIVTNLKLKGETGQKGDQGIPGQIGNTGPQGPPGLTGIPGVKGDVGPQGPKGDEGRPGPPGVEGIPGNEGLHGIPGLPGMKGEKGISGQTGAPGPSGMKGEKGPKGDTGFPGIQGPKGIKGDQGPIGPQGPQGWKGDRGAIFG